ncbi:MBL fold metallo-hydrolase [Roseimarinus sediminis]|uniref:MBL fold metallo-hydrolase n=1 Tax=Roseimarinus sediminis TaxID=1610899 RepID=UPI003D1FD877
MIFLKTILLTLFFGLSTIFVNGQNNQTVKSARVTYLANSGFIVQVGYEKVLFDGIFQNGMNRYIEPDENTVELMKNGLHPFDDIDVFFVSNFHADHFDPYVATRFMLNNEEVKMVCPQQVINKMKIFTSDFPKIADRIIEATPMANQYDRVLIEGFEILAMHVKHEKIENDHVENMSYLVSINGVKLFHSGDTDPETLDDLKGINISDLGVDIAFLNDKYGVGRAAKKTNKLVDARYNVLMHFEKYIAPKTLENFVERSKLKPRPHVFQIRNAYQDFYINDFYPEKNDEHLSLTLIGN